MHMKQAFIALALCATTFSSQAAWVYQEGGCTWSTDDGIGQIRVTSQGKVALLYTKQPCREAGIGSMQTSITWNGIKYPATQICNAQTGPYAITITDSQTSNMMLQDMVSQRSVSFYMGGKTHNVPTEGLRQNCRPMFH